MKLLSVCLKSDKEIDRKGSLEQYHVSRTQSASKHALLMDEACQPQGYMCVLACNHTNVYCMGLTLSVRGMPKKVKRCAGGTSIVYGIKLAKMSP